MSYGNPADKRIHTPNDFVSHMVEHIAWRLGCAIHLDWDNENWHELGRALGIEIMRISVIPEQQKESTAFLGSIDDGTVKVKLSQSENPGVEITSTENVNLDFFLNSRCEQINNHEPLTALLNGLTAATNLRIQAIVLNHKDSHHTWEGLFRSVGVCLNKMMAPEVQLPDMATIDTLEKNVITGDISVLERSLFRAKVTRGTAESGVEVTVDFQGKPENSTFSCDVKDSITKSVQGVDRLLKLFAKACGVRLDVHFTAKALSSSHVVLEDIGLVLGRALLEIIKLRFEKTGANGAGSSFQNAEDFDDQNGATTVSVEGRKFWDFIPLNGNEKQLQQNFIVGKDIFSTVRSEDLDDFFDGLSGGMTASIIVHIDDINNPDQLWQQVFTNLGIAIREVFEVNSRRKGLPPGVKATLS